MSNKKIDTRIKKVQRASTWVTPRPDHKRWKWASSIGRSARNTRKPCLQCNAWTGIVKAFSGILNASELSQKNFFYSCTVRLGIGSRVCHLCMCYPVSCQGLIGYIAVYISPPIPTLARVTVIRSTLALGTGEKKKTMQVTAPFMSPTGPLSRPSRYLNTKLTPFKETPIPTLNILITQPKSHFRPKNQISSN